MNRLIWIVLCSTLCGASAPLYAVDHLVTNNTEFTTALNNLADGDSIILAAGTYNGGRFVSNVSNVVVRSQSAATPAIIQGGNEGLHLTDVANFTIEDLIVEGAAANGINIDDGGSFVTPTTNITLRNVVVRNVGGTGNQDGIKLSGVTGFHLDRVRVTNWGEGGSGIDMVGSHNGVIENSFLQHPTLSGGGTGIRPKGGSKNIVIRANRLELPGGDGRPIQAGGSTGAAFFRFIDGDTGYEADNITVAGNIIVGGVTGASYVNIDGGIFHHNVIDRPANWIFRVLNENPASVETQNGVFNDNVVLFDNGLSGSFFNAGPNTQAGTFNFARNQWFNVDNPGASAPTLPAVETDGVSGVDPGLDLSQALAWEFAWGIWLINANEQTNAHLLAEPAAFRLAIPGAGAVFDPLLANPLLGDWTLALVTSPTVDLMPYSQAILIATAVPLPAAGGLLILGLGCLAGVRRRA